jgi:hypothetical protein
MRSIMMLAMLPLAACGAGEGGPGGASNGPTASRNFDLAGFEQVELRGSDDVTVRYGDAFAVRAEGGEEAVEALRIEVVDGRLRIQRDSKDSWFWSGNRRGAHVYVTMPKLTGARISGSGDMDVARGEGAFAASVSGSGNLVIGALAADSATLSISGSGDIEASGTAGTLDISISGSGDIDASGLTASRAKVSVAGSGDVTATVNGQASVSIVGSGDVSLGGGARCSISKVGSGDVTCG